MQTRLERFRSKISGRSKSDNEEEMEKIYPKLPINRDPVPEMQKTIKASTSVWSSLESCRSKHMFRKQNDLCSVKGIGSITAQRFRHMFVHNNRNYRAYNPSDPFISLPPHVRSMVDRHQVCKIVNESSITSAGGLLVLHVNARGLEKHFESFKCLVYHTRPHVVCVTETNDPDLKDVKLYDYKCEFTHSNKKGQGCKGGLWFMSIRT